MAVMLVTKIIVVFVIVVAVASMSSDNYPQQCGGLSVENLVNLDGQSPNSIIKRVKLKAHHQFLKLLECWGVSLSQWFDELPVLCLQHLCQHATTAALSPTHHHLVKALHRSTMVQHQPLKPAGVFRSPSHGEHHLNGSLPF